jgi:hypothetical protein
MIIRTQLLLETTTGLLHLHQPILSSGRNYVSEACTGSYLRPSNIGRLSRVKSKKFIPQIIIFASDLLQHRTQVCYGLGLGKCM